jgi:hypothetical protein
LNGGRERKTKMLEGTGGGATAEELSAAFSNTRRRRGVGCAVLHGVVGSVHVEFFFFLFFFFTGNNHMSANTRSFPRGLVKYV